MCNSVSSWNSSFSYDQNENILLPLPMYFSVSMGISSLTGITFSILNFIRFFREQNFRTYFNYIYHNMLFFSLSSSILYVPGLYVGVYLSWFILSPVFCSMFLIHSCAIFAGLAYLLMWTSLERHRFLFRLNITISLSQQILTLLIIILFVYTCSTLLVLTPKCFTHRSCEGCFQSNILVVLLFILYTFVIPIGIMICSTVVLFWRLLKDRTRINRRRRWILLKRMLYQSMMYLLWYCLAYWPFTIHSILLAYDFNRFDSVTLKSVTYLISFDTIQTLPILTYFLFKSSRKQTQEKYAMKTVHTKQEQGWIHKCLNKTNSPPIVERF